LITAGFCCRPLVGWTGGAPAEAEAGAPAALPKRLARDAMKETVACKAGCLPAGVAPRLCRSGGAIRGVLHAAERRRRRRSRDAHLK